MSSKSFKRKLIKKWKDCAHKANNKADQKRIDKNYAVLYPKTPPTETPS